MVGASRTENLGISGLLALNALESWAIMIPGSLGSLISTPLAGRRRDIGIQYKFVWLKDMWIYHFSGIYMLYLLILTLVWGIVLSFLGFVLVVFGFIYTLPEGVLRLLMTAKDVVCWISSLAHFP